MKAICQRRYGGPEVLELAEVQKPTPKTGQVLVKIHFASVNAADYRLMRADPWLVRLAGGLFRPKKWPLLGSDFSGTIEALGPSTTRFKIGDAVFGDSFTDGRGSFAEFICVSESSLALKPETLGFDQAAAVPLAAITALQALRDLGRVAKGDRVLIQGAGGGVGIFAVQIAQAMGAQVTAVCGPGSAELVSRLGAERVIDYSKSDFALEDARYDVLVAVHGYRPLATYKRMLKPGGRYVMVGGDARQLFEALLWGPLSFSRSGKKGAALTINDSLRQTDLEQLRALLAQGKLVPVIDRTFPLAAAAEAITYVERGHVRGKVLLKVAAGS